MGQVFTGRNDFRLIGQGQAANYLVHDNEHVTVDANGISPHSTTIFLSNVSRSDLASIKRWLDCPCFKPVTGRSRLTDTGVRRAQRFWPSEPWASSVQRQYALPRQCGSDTRSLDFLIRASDCFWGFVSYEDPPKLAPPGPA